MGVPAESLSIRIPAISTYSHTIPWTKALWSKTIHLHFRQEKGLDRCLPSRAWPQDNTCHSFSINPNLSYDLTWLQADLKTPFLQVSHGLLGGHCATVSGSLRAHGKAKFVALCYRWWDSDSVSVLSPSLLPATVLYQQGCLEGNCQGILGNVVFRLPASVL